MAIRETKTDLSAYSITTLESYINAVLSNSNKTADVLTSEGTDETYLYAYYESTKLVIKHSVICYWYLKVNLISIA